MYYTFNNEEKSKVGRISKKVKMLVNFKFHLYFIETFFNNTKIKRGISIRKLHKKLVLINANKNWLTIDKLTNKHKVITILIKI